MKNFCVIAVLATAALPILGQGPLIAQGVDKTVRSITITATAHVTSEADVATVRVGYLVYGPDKDAAYANGSRVSNAIADALKRAGVPKDAVESQSQNVAAAQAYELQNLSPTEKVARAFHVEQQWTVRANAADAARVLDLATRAGANQSGGIDWSLRDPNGAESAAATKAIQRARDQAAAMAEGLNVRLGVLLSASNTVESQPVRPVLMDMKARANNFVAQPEPLAINARQIETSATVTAVFAIE